MTSPSACITYSQCLAGRQRLDRVEDPSYVSAIDKARPRASGFTDRRRDEPRGARHEDTLSRRRSHHVPASVHLEAAAPNQMDSR